MTEEKFEDCIIKSKGSDVYYYGGSSFGPDREKARVFPYNKIPKHFLESADEEIVFLDYEKNNLEKLF